MEDQRIMAVLSHALGIFTAFVGALIIYLVAREDQSFARFHAKEALNFQITLALAAIVSGILIVVVIGIVGLVAVYVANLVFSVLAAMAANRNEEYRYPISIRLVK